MDHNENIDKESNDVRGTNSSHGSSGSSYLYLKLVEIYIVLYLKRIN